ncbi:MAG: phosphohistidine phosphatase SixA [Candidatus Omnitrophota bacterium]
MKIYFLRHGEAVDKTPGIEDKDRPLTSFGAATISNLARSLKGRASGFDMVFTSPLLRAAQTADIMANLLGCKDRIERSKSLLVGTPISTLIGELKRRRGLKKILIVGHQPQIGMVVSFLTGARESDMSISKGSCALVDTEDLKEASGKLVWIKGPDSLK